MNMKTFQKDSKHSDDSVRSLGFAIWQFKSTRGEFYLDLAKGMKASPGQAITKFLERAKDRYATEPLGILCRHWLIRFDHVGTFTESVRGTVPEEDLTVLAASERAGDLRTGLESLGKNIIGLGVCKKEIINTIISGVVLFLFLHIFLGIEAFMVMPKMEAAMKSNVDISKLGLIADILFTGARVIRNWWWAWFLLFGVTIAWVIWSLQNYVGRVRPWLDSNVLPYQMYRDFKGASFLIALGSITRLIGSQVVQLHDALTLMGENAYPWLRWHIYKIQENIQNHPNSKGEIFNTGIASKASYYRILDIAEYSQMSEMLNTVGDVILDTAPAETKKRAATIRYVLLAVSVSIMLGVYGGTFGLIDAFKVQIQLKAM